jgi:hypothetical protein
MVGGQNRIRVETKGSVTSVTVAPARNPISLVFGLLALCWGLGIGTHVVDGLRSGKLPGLGPKLFVAAGLLGTVAIAAVISFNVVWNLFGFWQTTFDTKNLTVTMRVGGLQRAWSYPLQDVRNVRVNEHRTRSRLVTRTIAFDYRGKIRHATPRLFNHEASALIDGPFRALTQQSAEP